MDKSEKEENNKIASISPILLSDWEDEDRACTVVQALSGFGKTSAYRELSDRTERAIWITADISDNDADHFLRKMERAWETIDEATMDQVGGPQEEGIWERIDALVDRTFFWRDKWIIVWDDVQMITSGEIWEYLSYFLDRTKTCLHMVFLTDTEPYPELYRMFRHEEAVIFDEQELRKKDEHVFLGWWYGLKLTEEYLKTKVSKGKKTAETETDLHILLRETGLSKAIEEVMWNPIPEELKPVIAAVASLDEFSWELVEAVMEQEVSRHQFEQIIAMTYMVERIRTGEEAEWFRFGDAYATFLRERITEKEKRGIYGRAALWFKDIGDHAGMVRYAIGGHQTGLLLEIVEKNGARLLAGRLALGQIIRYLEEEGVGFPAVAAGVAGQYYYAEGNMERMEEYLNAADSSFGKENRYGAYRSIYRALSRYDADPIRYEKQLKSSLFFLKENDLPMPWLKPEAEKRLERMLRAGEDGERLLRVESMGGFRVIAARDEKEIAWRTKKGRELFAYLTDLRGESVDRRRLMEVLWPEEIPTNAVAMLHNMIYNIRKELSDYGLEGILVYENKRYRLYTEDLTNMADPLFELTEAVESQDIKKLELNKAFFMEYPKRYLEDIDAAWADEKREYYDRIYRLGCELLAGHLMEQGKNREAIKLYQNIGRLDPYDEDTMAKILTIYGQEREWESMKRCYEAFEKRLREELGVAPGEAVVRAYEEGRRA